MQRIDDLFVKFDSDEEESDTAPAHEDEEVLKVE